MNSRFEYAADEMVDERATLLRAAAGGDEAAFEQIVDMHARLVWSVVRSFRLSHGDAEDAVQGVWLALVENLGRIRDPDRLPGWIATTARRECLRLIRRSARIDPGDGESIVERLAAMLPDPEHRLVAGERASAVAEAVSSLDDRCRQLLALLGTEPPIRYAGIADMLGIPIGSLGPTRQRCLDRVRHHPAIARLLEDGHAY